MKSLAGFAPVALSLLIVATTGDAAVVPYHGKSGANLKNALAGSCRPTQINARPLDFFMAAESDPRQIHDCFSDIVYTVSENDVMLPGEMDYVCVAPVEWWRFEREINHTYGDTVSRDFLNQFVGHRGISDRKRSYPPVDRLDRVTFDDGGFWQAGTLMFNGVETNGWMPPEDMRGDFARAFFYMVTLYPTELWDPWAGLILSDNTYPAFTAYGCGMLLEWHRRDPVSESERRRNAAAERFQGNRNPFVDDPQLVEYLWGLHAGEIYHPGGDDDVTPVALRSTYRLSDPRIDLWSPLVSEEARWSVDGTPVTVASLSPAALGAGRHCLTYTVAGGELGMVQIEIVP